jgi:hypothetical protein
MIDLFKSIIPAENQSKNFKLVQEGQGFSSARATINNVYNSIKPIDDDFIQQFQSSGFDARIWELYLSAVFQEKGFSIPRIHTSPDFELVKGKTKIFIEAVTSNPSYNREIENKSEILKNLKESEYYDFIINLRDESTIKLAGALFNKHKQKYWELDWVKGHPLVLAIEPFHHSMAHFLSDSNLISYLYGIDHKWHYNEKSSLIIDTVEVKEHTKGEKKIPSNFFNLEGSEYISAVFFSNSGTISKFNRIGKLKKLGDKKVKMVRSGFKYDHDPNSANPIPFSYIVGQDGPYETWAQGLSMFHNPNAKFPIDKSLFPGILHGYFDKKFYAYIPDFFPIQSETQILVPRPK